MTSIRFSLLFCASCLLSACASAPVTQDVYIPVHQRIELPAELKAPWKPGKLPVFVSPIDPAATSALTREGEWLLKDLIFEMQTRIRALEAWAKEDDNGNR